MSKDSQKDNKNEVVIKRIEDVVSSIKNKDFTLYFFVVDSKNTPNGSNAYIYNIAKTLNDGGYNVKMLYQLENEYTDAEMEQVKKGEIQVDETRIFRGVKEWLGEEFGTLEHMNISKNEWRVSPADFLFIPEALSALMFETFKHKIPCKRYVILQNFDYITEFIPMGVEWMNYGITDAIATTEQAKKDIESVFPYVKTRVLNPGIPEYFRKPIEPKKLIVSLVSKSQSDVNKIVKTFYWKYPIYKFVSFRDLRGFPREKFSNLLKESAITIWVDDNTKFGYSAIEAIRCNNILIGKVPQDIPEWMGNEEGLYDNGVWFENIKNVPQILASVIGAWMNDDIPQALTDAMNETNSKYKESDFKDNTLKLFNDLFDERIHELESYEEMIRNSADSVIE